MRFDPEFDDLDHDAVPRNPDDRPDNPVTFIPEGQEYPDPEGPDEPPVEFEPKRLAAGDRVTLKSGPDLGPGTVLGIDLNRATVGWDVMNEWAATVFSTDELQLDADLPDPRLALGKALSYKRSRDEMLKQLWGTADTVTEAQLETGRAYSIAHEMTRRYDLQRVQLGRARESVSRIARQDQEARRVLADLGRRLTGVDFALAQAIRDYLEHGEPWPGFDN